MMPEDGLAILADFDAIFLGAVGRPDVPDDVSLWGLLIPIRQSLRPVREPPSDPAVRRRASAGDAPRRRDDRHADRPGEHGGRVLRVRRTRSCGEHAREFAVQNDIFTRIGIERITRYACERAVERRGHVTSATKSNGIIHTMPFWDEVVAGVVAEFPELSFDKRLIDALAAELVLRPSDFDVIVASNLYGDILSDLAAAIVGSLGIAASANLNPERRFPSMFEPVHGSAPDIAGLGVANPIAAVWSGALMLEHLGRDQAAQRIMRAVEETLAGADTRTRDLGGTAATQDVVDALLVALRGEPAPER